MTAGEVITLATTIVQMIVACVFFGLWSRMGRDRTILAFTVTHVLSTFGFFANFMLPREVYPIAGNLVSNAFLLACLVPLGWGLVKSAGERPPLLLLISIMLAGYAVEIWYVTMPLPYPTFLPLIYMIYGLLWCIPAISLWRKPRAYLTDRAIAFFLTFEAAYFFIAPWIFLASHDVVTEEVWRTSNMTVIYQLIQIISTLALSIFVMISSFVKAINKERESARRDRLSGVLTRGAFEDDADQVISAAQRTPVPLTFVMADVDHFKKVNDTWGHAAGDAIISAMGMTFAGTCRASDVVGRVGGEEFCMLLWNSDLAGGRLLAEGLRTKIETLPVHELHKGIPEDHKITSSFGVAQWKPNESLAETMARADAQLYHAKKRGRNQVACDENKPKDELPLAV